MIDTHWASRSLTHKRYELSNHPGNPVLRTGQVVLSTITDRKSYIDSIEVLNGEFTVEGGDTTFLKDTVVQWEADILLAQDYNPAACLVGCADESMLMPGRVYQRPASIDTAGDDKDSTYRFGFNGKEQDPSWSGNGNIYDYGFRIYNPRIGKFLSVDPLTANYPWYTPYQFAGNTPIWAIDLDGLEEAFATDYFDEDRQQYYRKYTLNPNANEEDKGKIQFEIEKKRVGEIKDAEGNDLRIIQELRRDKLRLAKQQAEVRKGNRRSYGFTRSKNRPLGEDENPILNESDLNEENTSDPEGSKPVLRIDARFTYHFRTIEDTKEELRDKNSSLSTYLNTTAAVSLNADWDFVGVYVPNGDGSGELFETIKKTLVDQGVEPNFIIKIDEPASSEYDNNVQVVKLDEL